MTKTNPKQQPRRRRLKPMKDQSKGKELLFDFRKMKKDIEQRNKKKKKSK